MPRQLAGSHGPDWALRRRKIKLKGPLGGLKSSETGGQDFAGHTSPERLLRRLREDGDRTTLGPGLQLRLAYIWDGPRPVGLKASTAAGPEPEARSLGARSPRSQGRQPVADQPPGQQSTLSEAEWIGSAGVFLLLVTFFLNLVGVLRHDAWSYLVMNALGAGVACYASLMIEFYPLSFTSQAFVLA